MDAKENREQIIRDAKSSLILDAARKVFAEKGYHDTRLDDIAAQAGFSKAALYNYYNDKESIFLSLANRDFELLFEAIKNNLDPSAQFLDNLQKILNTVFSFFGEHFAFLLATTNFHQSCNESNGKIGEYHEKLFCQFKKKYSQVFEVFTEVLKEGKRRGEISYDLDEKIISQYLVSLLRGILIEWKSKGLKGESDVEIKQVISFLTNGLNIRN
jgi:AcrR family transcriptional regulator